MRKQQRGQQRRPRVRWLGMKRRRLELLRSMSYPIIASTTLINMVSTGWLMQVVLSQRTVSRLFNVARCRGTDLYTTGPAAAIRRQLARVR